MTIIKTNAYYAFDLIQEYYYSHKNSIKNFTWSNTTEQSQDHYKDPAKELYHVMDTIHIATLLIDIKQTQSYATTKKKPAIFKHTPQIN